MQPTTRESRRIHPIKPIFEPFDQASGQLVELILKRLKFPSSGPKAARYRVMVASIVHSALVVTKRVEHEKDKPRSKRKAVMLGMAIGNDNWTRYPLVGADVGTKVLSAFEKAGYLLPDPDTGKRKFYTTPSGKNAYNSTMTCWTVSLPLETAVQN